MNLCNATSELPVHITTWSGAAAKHPIPLNLCSVFIQIYVGVSYSDWNIYLAKHSESKLRWRHKAGRNIDEFLHEKSISTSKYHLYKNAAINKPKRNNLILKNVKVNSRS